MNGFEPSRCRYPFTMVMAMLLFLFNALPAQERSDVPARPDPQQTLVGRPVLSSASSWQSSALSSPRGKPGHVLLSLVLPGAGEWAMGRRTAAKIFFGAELTLWLGYLASKQYTHVLLNDLKSFAAVHAGVNTAGKPDQYWIDVGTAGSLEDFNNRRLNDRDLEGMYPEGQGFEWQWDSEAHRVEYVKRRFRRLDWKRTSTVLLGGIVLNHIVSAVDVIRLIRKEKAAAASRRKSLLRFQYAATPEQGETLQLRLTVGL